MEEKVRLSYLYDFYGELLNPGQRELFNAFVFCDLSLQELADEMGISRQAVHDRIRRSTHIMEDYESKLHLIDKNNRISDLINEARLRLDTIAADGDKKDHLRKLLSEITEVL